MRMEDEQASWLELVVVDNELLCSENKPNGVLWTGVFIIFVGEKVALFGGLCWLRFEMLDEGSGCLQSLFHHHH
jgi:hypothetical protein